MRKRVARGAGFTLMELLVVLMILGLLVGLVAPKYFSQVGKSQVQVGRTQIDMLEKALEAYRMDNGGFPTASQGLRALVEKPAGEERWNGPYLKKEVPLDPWGREYVYQLKAGSLEPLLSSYGRDGLPGGAGEDSDIGTQ